MTNQKEESLYTDYAMQIITAFASRDEPDAKYVNLALLLSTYEDELNDPGFIPGILLGMLVHCELLVRMLSIDNDDSFEEYFSKYALHYASIREELCEIKALSPSYTAELIQQFENRSDN